MGKRLYLVNDDSATVRKKGSRLQALQSNYPSPLHHVTDFSNIKDIVKEARETQTEWVLIEGGDGTVHGVLTAFMQMRDAFEVFPKFTIIPGGMTNQIASHIGFRYKSREALKRLVSGVTGKPMSMPLLQLSAPDAPDQFGFLFSSGAVPMATEYCKEKLHNRGIGGSLAVAATILKGVAGSEKARNEMMPPTPVKLRVTTGKDEVWLEDEHLGTLVTTLPGIMLGLDPFWGKGEAALRVTYVKADAKHLLRHAIDFLLEGKTPKDKSIRRQSDGLESFSADILKYRYTGPVVLDGEPIEMKAGELEIRASAPVAFIT